MTRTNARNLIGVTGPVGGGKSTTAIALAARLRLSEQTAAVVDLDDVYAMAKQGPGWGELTAWTSARQGCGALAAAFFDSGIDTVVIDGEFFDAGMVADLLKPVPPDVSVTWIALLLSFADTLRRVQADENRRGLPSSNPDFLKQLHDQYRRSLPFLHGHFVCLEAGRTPVAQLVETMMREIAVA
jgi:hypothetical protein